MFTVSVVREEIRVIYTITRECRREERKVRQSLGTRPQWGAKQASLWIKPSGAVTTMNLSSLRPRPRAGAAMESLERIRTPNGG